MPTPLTKPVTRKVTTLRGAPLNVTLSPEGIRFREYKRKKSFLLPYGVAFLEAVHLYVAAERAAKAAARKAKKQSVKRGR